MEWGMNILLMVIIIEVNMLMESIMDWECIIFQMGVSMRVII